MRAGEIRGRIVLDGTPPRAARIQVTEPPCAARHPGGLFDESVLAGPGGGLRNVFVYVSRGAPSPPPVPETPVRLLQLGCTYLPRVFGIRAGQPLEIVNADPASHNIHALAKRGRPFNAGMPGKARPWAVRRVFTAPEVMVRIRCDVHPWMLGWAGVTAHPWFAVSGRDGTFVLPPLPPGTYEVTAWHERCGTLTRTVAVPPGGAAVRADFDYRSVRF